MLVGFYMTKVKNIVNNPKTTRFFHLLYKDIFRSKTQDQAPFPAKIFLSSHESVFLPKVLFIYRFIFGVYNR